MSRAVELRDRVRRYYTSYYRDVLGIPDWAVLVGLREDEEQQERGRLDRLRRLLGGDVRGRLLNVGCGTGGFNLVVEEAGARPVGVDADAEAIAICALKQEKGGGAFVRAAAERLPFPDGTFDVVYCFSSIEHVESVEESVAEMPGPGTRATTSCSGRRSCPPRWDGSTCGPGVARASISRPCGGSRPEGYVAPSRARA